MARNVCIIGDGGWGTALALVLHERGHRVTVWGPFPEYIGKVRQTRRNEDYLPGVDIPAGIRWDADRDSAVQGADLVVVAVPTRFYRSVMESFAGLVPASAEVVSVAKGFDPQSHQRMTDVLADVLKRDDMAALSGPSHAEEVARRMPTAVVVASRSGKVVRSIQEAFSTARFRVYTSDDVVGVELGGALKNVIAVGAGIVDGIGFGDNTRAALITRGLAEMIRLGVALGARPATFAGLSGIGDLIVTCNSKLSRNHAVGERLGRGENIGQILGSMKQVAEGVWNCAIACDLARQCQVQAPIAEEVHAVVHKGRNPIEAVEALMSRDAKPE
jgi:glycerol-3-phosphate dehydrogenase (NAD(P)+)